MSELLAHYLVVSFWCCIWNDSSVDITLISNQILFYYWAAENVDNCGGTLSRLQKFYKNFKVYIIFTLNLIENRYHTVSYLLLRERFRNTLSGRIPNIS